ncbi:hypothetical protein [Pseudomonas serbica]|uniref:hypothetical protein n=1 Tax=Pseudomonas serbica TaxID=2965074 RepID=UPI00237A09B4|nr:hypothetical protein [Pseudomonas serbica]
MSQHKPVIVAYQVVAQIVNRNDFDHYKKCEKVTVDDEAYVLDLLTRYKRSENDGLEVSHLSLEKWGPDIWQATIEAVVVDESDLKERAIIAAKDSTAEGELLNKELEWLDADASVTQMVAEVVTISNDANRFCYGIEIGVIHTVKPTHTSFPKIRCDENSSPSP